MRSIILGTIGFVAYLVLTQILNVETQTPLMFTFYIVAVAGPIIEKRSKPLNFREVFTHFMRPIIFTQMAIFLYMVVPDNILNPERAEAEFQKYSADVEESYAFHKDSLTLIIDEGIRKMEADKAMRDADQIKIREQIEGAQQRLDGVNQQYANLTSTNPFSLTGRLFNMFTGIIMFSVLGLVTAAFLKTRQHG
jgi:hypothetical protein